MPILHVDKLRSGESSEDEYTVVETIRLPRWGTDAAFTAVGHPHPRIEGEEKVTGRARYAYDIRLPGLLYARVLRSPLPHARIRRIDTSRTAALAGVRAVLTSASAPDITWYQDSLLFDSTVRYIGDEVTAVAADAEEVAEDALRLIDVEYEPLPFVVDLEAALRADARRSGSGACGRADWPAAWGCASYPERHRAYSLAGRSRRAGVDWCRCQPRAVRACRRDGIGRCGSARS